MSSRRAGFTLLEVLLATAVGAAIMAGIFSVMRVQTRLTEDGGRRVEEAQLARGLLDLMGQDIRHCVPASGTAEMRLRQAAAEIPFAEEIAFGDLLEPTVTASYVPAEVRQFNLAIVGDEGRLILSPHRSSAEESAEAFAHGQRNGKLTQGGGGPSALLPRQVNRLRTSTTVEGVLPSQRGGFARVAYFVLDKPTGEEPAEQPEAGGEAEIAPQQGLVRLEHTQLRSENALVLVSQALARLRKPPQADSAESDRTGSPLEGSGVRAELVAPEVKHLALRYYDGSFWHWRWDGSAGLPRAVEIELGLSSGSRAAAAAASPSTTATPQAGDEKARSHTQAAVGSDTAELRIYRLTVRVPTAGWPEAAPPADSLWAQPGASTPLGSADFGSRHGAVP